MRGSITDGVNDASLQNMLERAVALHRAGRLPEAGAMYEAVLARDVENPDALNLLGLVRHKLGDSHAGVALIRRAIARNPNGVSYHVNLAGILVALDQLPEAVASLERAYALQPADATVLRQLATALTKLGVWQIEQDRPAEAAAALERALKLVPQSADALGNYGLALAKMKRHEEAVATYQRALAELPDSAEIHTNLGAAMQSLGRLDEAVAAQRRACELRPGWPMAMCNLAIALALQGKTEEALTWHEAVLRDHPDEPTALINRGVIRLARGEFTGGWRDYEARRRLPQLGPHLSFNQPRLTPADEVAGRTVLVHAEQGIGDTLQFARYVPLLAARGARVIFLCDAPSLETLLRHSLVDAEYVPTMTSLPRFDAYISVLSLPWIFGTTIATIPSHVPYLSVPPDAKARWSSALDRGDGDDVLRVGIVWSGNPANFNDRNRSIPLSVLLRHLPSHPGVQYYSLQKGPAAGQLGSAPHVVDVAQGLTDFADTAAAIAQLDLVITVDTSVAHLAGALGANVWTLLPEPADFRWLIGREDSPWYPTMRLFRQKRAGDWDDVLERAAAELVRLGGSRRQ